MAKISQDLMIACFVFKKLISHLLQPGAAGSPRPRGADWEDVSKELVSSISHFEVNSLSRLSSAAKETERASAIAAKMNDFISALLIKI